LGSHQKLQTIINAGDREICLSLNSPKKHEV